MSNRDLVGRLVARCGGKFAAAHMIAERARQKQDLFRAKQARLHPDKTAGQRPAMLGGEAVMQAMNDLLGPAGVTSPFSQPSRPGRSNRKERRWASGLTGRTTTWTP